MVVAIINTNILGYWRKELFLKGKRERKKGYGGTSPHIVLFRDWGNGWVHRGLIMFS